MKVACALQKGIHNMAFTHSMCVAYDDTFTEVKKARNQVVVDNIPHIGPWGATFLQPEW